MKPEMGRPRIAIDWKTVDGMAGIMCTASEIAAATGISEDTYLRRCKEEHGVTFAEYLKEKQSVGKVSLRRVQMKKAMEGDNTMLIWLGKQYLDQQDRYKNDHVSSDGSMSPAGFDVSKLSDSALEELIAIKNENNK